MTILLDQHEKAGRWLSPAERERVAKGRELIEAGSTWKAAAAQIGMSYWKLRTQADPAYAQQRRDNVNRNRREHGSWPVKVVAPTSHTVERHVTPAEAAAALATVPPDTRGRTARICGDPLPGRSALDKMRTAFSPLLTSATDVGGKVVRSVNGP